ncbi:MAG: glucosaminidase domain-containing protein [Puniceicoccales bacterium]|jgi:hypothetical protein|nr:glucosaminidase domain-containing protein [Puniceicoccales bacterium]
MKWHVAVRYLFLVFVSVFMLVGCNFVASSYKKTPDSNLPLKKDSPRYSIMGKGVASEQAMLEYLLKHNRRMSTKKTAYIVRTYMWECAYEGVNHDIAFVQMCHETGFLHFKGAVSPSQNNFCGLGTLSDSHIGLFFPDIRTGIRAHVQHLKAYASSQPLTNRCVDPRFALIKRGSATNIFELTGKWAVDRRYGESIKKKIDTLIDIENSLRNSKNPDFQKKSVDNGTGLEN